MLPLVVREFIETRAANSRQHIQSLIYVLYLLQLLRPVDTNKDIASMPLPPDSKDVFSSIPVMSPKNLCFGYQLVGKARLLSKDGYELVRDAYNSTLTHSLDLTTGYLNDDVYDMLDKDGQFKYWSDLYVSAMTEAKHLTAKHLLYGIGLAHYWVLDVSLNDGQIALLHLYVDKAECTTPLGNHKLLTEAAKGAGTTFEEARRYYMHKHLEMHKQSTRQRAYQKSKKMPSTKGSDASDDVGSDASDDAIESLKSNIKLTEDDLLRVAVCYAVMKHHAKSYHHIFEVDNIGDFFPNISFKVNCDVIVRYHWTDMQCKAKSRLRCDQIYKVWKYVLRDAIERGDLKDSEVEDPFDTQKAVDYYCNLLRDYTLEDLLSHYANDLAKDDVVFEAVESTSED
ncbi:hypothetical protein GGI24_005918 [Coemansia furcata]|nr:hypothetical protein GGI24_005918 [Coemansia furcata]